MAMKSTGESTSKVMPVVLFFFFILFAIVSSLLFLKVSSLEKRLAGVPKASEIDRRFGDLEGDIEKFKSDSFQTTLDHHERLSALETGIGKPVLTGPQTLDFLLSSLKTDYLAFRDAASEPDKEWNLGERLESTLGKLEKKAEAGEDVVAAMAEELRRNQDPFWKEYLIRDVIGRMGPQALELLMSFFRDRTNSYNLRVLAARSAADLGGRTDLEEMARHLENREEDLGLKTGLATLFYDHPFSGAEPGLIEGVRGVPDEEGVLQLYNPTHRRACVRALGRYDSARVVRFLEELLLEVCSPVEDDKEDPYIPVLAIDAYHLIQRERAVDYFELMLETYPEIDDNLRIKITNILDKYADTEPPREGSGGGS
jgi:hypothetical protein